MTTHQETSSASTPAMTGFDPDAAASADGIFGLPHTEDQSLVVITPVPFDATTSYHTGTAGAPEAVHEASMQVDLFDHQYGRLYEHGIFLREADEQISTWSNEARAIAEPIILAGGEGSDDDLAKVNAYSKKVEDSVYASTKATLDAGKIPALLGGDHSTPLGAMRAVDDFVGAENGKFGILQIDAHMDLRIAFEGFEQSHASILHNALDRCTNLKRVVMIGIRDYCEAELNHPARTDGRVVTHFDQDWARRKAAGETVMALIDEAIQQLPDLVYITVDIDGLSPELCPGTGTPVPGGLNFGEYALILERLVRAGKRVIGFDLVEVCPTDGDREWNASVGARALYKLCGCAMASRGVLGPLG
ncbi:MAG: agmatinase family protein [bacterium]|nr:agmatinase family protein [bacterium]